MSRRKTNAKGKAHTKPEKTKKRIAYAVLLLILLYSAVYSVTFAIGPSHMDDDLTYAYMAYYWTHGTFVQHPGDSLSVRTLEVIPTGVFYALFGVGALQSAGWGMTCFVLSVLIAYMIGKELYDDYVGLLSAFLLSIFPLVAVYSTTMSDNLPMLLFSSTAMLSLISATKYDSKKWYFLAGASALAAPLATPEGFVLWVMLGAYVMLELARKKITVNRTTMFLAYGFLFALALTMAFNYLNAGRPLITFTANSAYYGQISRPDIRPIPLSTALNFYPQYMFPYDIVASIRSGVSGAGANLPLVLSNILKEVLRSDYIWGMYFYLMVPACLLLLLVRDRRAYRPMLWLAVGLFYLEFGAQHISINPFAYILMHRLDRYLILVAEPLVVVISASLFVFVSAFKGRLRYFAIAAVIALVGITAFTSLRIINFFHEVNVASQYTHIQIAHYLSSFPNNTLIYADESFGDITVYMHFDNFSRFMYGYGGASNCSGIPAGAYVVMPKNWQNQFTQCEANWTLVLAPNTSVLNSRAASFTPLSMGDLYRTP